MARSKQKPQPPIIPNAQKAQLKQLIVESFEQYSGPLPPPKAMKEYEEVLPGIAERIMNMAEEEAEHRHIQEKEVVKIMSSVEKYIISGQRYAFWLGVVGLFAAVGIAYLDPRWGSVLGVSTIVSLIISLIIKRKGEPPIEQ